VTKQQTLDAVRKILPLPARDEIAGILGSAYTEVAPPKLVESARSQT
jgi:hypothetical protein